MKRILFSGDGSSGDLLPMVLMAREFKQAGYDVWYDPAATVTHFYEREERGVFHPQLKNHLRSILRFQIRNMWRLKQIPVIHRRDLDGSRVPQIATIRDR